MGEADKEVRLIADQGRLRQRLYLVKSGVPWDVAFSIDDVEATAYCIVFGEIEGGRWDWDAMRWKERK